MKVGSLFAGIGGFDLGFERAGFKVAWCVEWDKNAQAVLRKRFPNAQVYGDIREVDPDKLERVDVICGGFPCQDLSVAGKRAGLAGERSGLFHDAMRIVRRLRPSILVLENVPGLLSSNRGLDFATVLREVGEGWDCAEVGWRVLDSQYFGVAQRRRRVFVVAGSRAGCAEQILALAEGGGGDPPSRDKARQDASADAASGTRGGRWWDGSDCSATLTKQNANGSQRMPDKGNLGAVVQSFTGSSHAQYSEGVGTLRASGDECQNLIVGTIDCDIPKQRVQNFCAGHWIPCAIQGNLIGRDQGGPHGVGAREDGTMYTLTKTDIHAVAFHPTQDPISSTGTTHALGCGSKQGCATVAVAVDVWNQTIDGECSATLTSATGGTNTSGPKVLQQTIVRRLTPVECERLQGFPDGWTQIGTDKPTADTHRYKQLGNAVTVNVAEWIARRTMAWLT